MRLLFAVVVLYMFEDARPFDLETQKHPNGIARFVDLTWLSLPGMREGFFVAAALLLVFYLLGIGLWIVLPLLVLVFTLPHTLQNSQGYILHKFQIVTLVILAQAFVANYAKWGRRKAPVTADTLRSWFVYYSQGMIAATYVTSVVSKLINSKGLWLWKTGYMAVDQVKAWKQEYYRTLNPEFAGENPIAIWMVEHPWLTRMIFGSGFFLEIAALAALHSRKWALWIGLALIAMHRSIAAVMNLDFRNHEWVVFIFFVNVPFWAMWAAAKFRRTDLPAAG